MATSRDLTSAASFVAAAAALAAVAPLAASWLKAAVANGLTRAFGREPLTSEGAVATLLAAISVVLWIVVPVAGAALVAAALAATLQTGGLIAASSIAPRLERINPLAGFRRLASLRTSIETAKAWLKVGVVAVAAATSALHYIRPIGAAFRSLDGAPLALVAIMLRDAATRAGIALLALACADVLLQRRLHERDLRMTKDEVRRDLKEDEGDPHIKSARRQAHRALAMEQMIAAARTASVVVVNPTHVATAIRYDPKREDAPRVVAKGANHIAARIRRAAGESGVRVVRNRPLARALFTVPVDSEIPESLFAAVAEVLAYVAEVVANENTA